MNPNFLKLLFKNLFAAEAHTSALEQKCGFDGKEHAICHNERIKEAKAHEAQCLELINQYLNGHSK